MRETYQNSPPLRNFSYSNANPNKKQLIIEAKQELNLFEY